MTAVATAFRAHSESAQFFSSSLADVALKARSLHEHKLSERHLYKDRKCPFCAGKSKQTTQKPQKTTNTTTRKSPSQTCVSPEETAKQTAKQQTKTKNGARAQTKTPTKSICHGTQWLCPLHHYQKRAKELKITAFRLT